MKYVIGKNRTTGYLDVAVFSDEIVHAKIAKCFPNCDIQSAGFVGKKNDKWFTHGDSESLKIKPKEGDDVILHFFLEYGLSGLALENLLSAFRCGLPLRQLLEKSGNSS